MDGSPKLSGETLIVHHIPLVHCQVSGGRQGGCGGSMKRGNPFSPPENLGLSRTTSLPERDVLQREALVFSSLIQTTSGSLSSRGARKNARGGGSTASDDSSFASSNSEDQLMMMAAHTLPRAKTRSRNPLRHNPLRHNPFLLNAEEDDEEEEEEDDGDGYFEDSSFHLHGEAVSALDGAVAPFHLHELGFAAHQPFLLQSSAVGKPWGSSRESLRAMASDLSAHLEELDLLGLTGGRRHGSSGSNVSMDCDGEQDWADEEEEEDDDHLMRCGRSSKTGSSSSGSSTQQQRCSCCGLSQNYPEHFPEPFSECGQGGYGSDSSCNSSDGVLVNFSAIYNKMNNAVPAEKAPALGPTINLNNSSTDHSCTSSVSETLGGRRESSSTAEAFYLDLHTSPTDPPPPPQSSSSLRNPFPVLREPLPSTSSTCSCSAEHQGALLDLDANCNSYHPPPHSGHGGSSGDLASCLQSQARLVVATQNYYKLVTCDLSSQSSPSPVGSSSLTSCSEEHSKSSPTPTTQPSEYYLFRRWPGDEGGVEEEEEEEEEAAGETSKRAGDGDDEEDEEEEEEEEENKNRASDAVIEGQVYVNVSPPVAGRAVVGGGAISSTTNRPPRSRSYDRHLDLESPPPRLGSLERMLSCPVRLSEGGGASPQAAAPLHHHQPPPRVTSFAEIARSKRRNGAGSGGSPSMKAAGGDPFSSMHSAHSHSSADFSPIPEQQQRGQPDPLGGLSPVPFTRCYSQGSADRHPLRAREERARTEGGLSSSSDGCQPVVRYSKDQRPTTLPIQPFTFHHQFASKPSQPKALPPLFAGPAASGSGMQARTSSGGSGGPVAGEQSQDAAQNVHTFQQGATATGLAATAGPPPPGSVRPSPLGSYSPVRLQGAPGACAAATSSSGGTCSTCTPSPQRPPRSLSCPASGAGLAAPLLLHTPPPPAVLAAKPPTPPPAPLALPLGVKRGAVPPMLPAVQGHCCHHAGVPSDSLSPLARMDPSKQLDGARTHNGGSQASRQLQQSYSDLLPDYFSLASERPPEEFCLSPDASSSSSASSSAHTHVSVDLAQKRGLVKAVNTAVDLIVAHFGTSRDPDVKAKLGNSWVSPNVGHLILKYLCPALRAVLQDGLKAYVLDLIIGQRRCQPWSVVEAATQLGPSTRVLHSLFSKVSQYSELTSHSMRLNAFIFGLLNLRSLEFCFNHLYTHEDIVAAHYNAWGFLPMAQGACQPLFEELLLLLQPLSLLPFDLDLLFEPHLLQKGREQLRRKELLCSAGQGAEQSTRSSTFQLMRGWSTAAEAGEAAREEADSTAEGRRERAGLRRDGTWPRVARTEGVGSRREGVGLQSGLRMDRMEAGLVDTQAMMELGFTNLWKERGASGQRLKGVGGESQAESQDGEKERRKERERDSSEEEGRQRQDRQAGWWYQLMQSSQVYIDQSTEGSKFVKSEKRRKSSTERRPCQLPPTREGVVEGAESSHEGEERRSAAGGRPSWMGSPPESVLTQDKETSAPRAKATEFQAAAPQGGSPAQGQSMRWGRLFGSSTGSPARAEAPEQRAKAQRSRPPSGWLGLDRSVLDLVAQSIGAGKKSSPLPPPPQTPAPPPPPPPPPAVQTTQTKKSPCEVRALCHHIATEPGQLSFHKGDVLRVLSKADPDWLLCSLGASRGLVPIIYVTLAGMDDSREPTEPGQR